MNQTIVSTQRRIDSGRYVEMRLRICLDVTDTLSLSATFISRLKLNDYQFLLIARVGSRRIGHRDLCMSGVKPVFVMTNVINVPS